MMNNAVTRAGARHRRHCRLKTMEVKGHFKCFDNLLKNVVLKDETIAECLVESSHVTTLQHKAVSAASGNKQTAVSGLLAAV